MSATDRQLLREILTRLENIEALLKPRDGARSSEDRDAFQRLLPALGGRFGSSPFRTAEVFADEALRVLLGERSRHQVGNLFSRFAGIPLDGYVLTRSETEHGARLWVVRGVPNSPSLPDPLSRELRTWQKRTRGEVA